MSAEDLLLDVPLPKQYIIRVGIGEYGPNLQNTVPAHRTLNLTDLQTNMNYIRVRMIGLGLMFSRGGFLSTKLQTNHDEKTLFAVCLHKCKIRPHNQFGETYDEVMTKIHAGPPICPELSPGRLLIMRWGVTYSILYDDHNIAPSVIHLRAELFVAPGEEEEEGRDSPPPIWTHGRDPSNFYAAAGINDRPLVSMSPNPLLEHMNRILRTMSCEACQSTATNCKCPCGQSTGTCDCPDCPECRDKKHTCEGI